MTLANANANAGLLAVEGLTDHRFVIHLCRKANPALGTRFSCRNYRGQQGVLDVVRGLVNSPEYTALGFLLDADNDPAQRWRDVTDRIAAANSDIQIPPAPDGNGTIIPANPDFGSPRIGIWIMPDNSSAGELENFVTQMIPDSDQVWPLAQAYINDIPVQHRKFNNDKIAKSQVHAWLAARKHPGRMGLAVRDDLATNGQLCQRFLAWLNRLFA